MTNASPNTGRTVGKLCLLVLVMFGFCYSLVPMYYLLCKVTGLGGRTGPAYAYDPAVVKEDENRSVQVNFITNTNAGMPWEFWAETGGVRVHPGQLKEVKFYVRNNTDRTMVGQAVPSLVPNRAADFFHKTECFCFRQQILKPGEVMEMPMRFIVGPELPGNIPTISLSYALFDVTEFAAAKDEATSTSG